jgi:hypothetical protein
MEAERRIGAVDTRKDSFERRKVCLRPRRYTPAADGIVSFIVEFSPSLCRPFLVLAILCFQQCSKSGVIESWNLEQFVYGRALCNTRLEFEFAGLLSFLVYGQLGRPECRVTSIGRGRPRDSFLAIVYE